MRRGHLGILYVTLALARAMQVSFQTKETSGVRGLLFFLIRKPIRFLDGSWSDDNSNNSPRRALRRE